jgi:hypothetical protein
LCEENNELSELFDVCFLDNGLHFLNGHFGAERNAPPKGNPVPSAFAFAQAVRCRRRHKVSRPNATTQPGRPVPTMGQVNACCPSLTLLTVPQRA